MEAGGERRDDHRRPVAGAREFKADLMVMRIAGQEHAGGPEGPIRVENGDESLTDLLMRDLHPAGRDRLAWAHGRTSGRKAETDKASDELVFGPETLQTNGIQPIQVAAAPRITDAALGHQEILAGAQHGHSRGAKEDDVHHARAQDVVRRGVERIGVSSLGDTIQPSHVVVRLRVT